MQRSWKPNFAALEEANETIKENQAHMANFAQQASDDRQTLQRLQLQVSSANNAQQTPASTSESATTTIAQLQGELAAASSKTNSKERQPDTCPF